MPSRLEGPRTAICPSCGRGFVLSKAQRYYHRKNPNSVLYCSKECRLNDLSGERNPKWRGGQTITKGYIYVYCPEHPYATRKGYVAEHRLVMEEMLGRFLDPREVVHHINRLHARYRTRDRLGRFDGHQEAVAAYI